MRPSTFVILEYYVAVSANRMALMQQQRRPGSQTRDPVPSAPPREVILTSSVSSTTASSTSVGTDSLTSRRVALGQNYFETAKKVVSEALGKDEAGDRMAALELYNKVLATVCLGLGQVKSGREPAMVELRKKLEKMKDQVKSRMERLLDEETEARQLAASTGDSSPKPVSRTGQASLSASTTSRTGTRSVQDSVEGGSTRVGAKADLVFNMESGVGLFQVDGQDHVRKFEDVDNLSVFRYHERIKGQPPAFLQCNGFIYPLIPGRSPVLKASERVYMFPDLKGEDGCSVGLSLEGASEEDISELDKLLTVMADMRHSETASREEERERGREGVREKEKERVREGVREEKKGDKPTWGTTIAGGIEKGVGLVSKGIAIGTEAAGNLITKGGNKLREKIEPNEKATEIPESVQKGVHVAKKASGYVVGVSDFLMMSLAKLTVAVGKEVKNAVADTEYVKGMEVNPHAKEAWKVTKSGVKGVASVFGDLERGGAALLGSASYQTAKTVEHKYGEQAGNVTSESIETGKNVANLTYTYWSWKTWGIRFLGKVGEVISRKSDNTTQSSPSSSKSSPSQ